MGKDTVSEVSLRTGNSKGKDRDVFVIRIFLSSSKYYNSAYINRTLWKAEAIWYINWPNLTRLIPRNPTTSELLSHLCPSPSLSNQVLNLQFLMFSRTTSSRMSFALQTTSKILPPLTTTLLAIKR